MDNKDNCHWRLSASHSHDTSNVALAKQPHTQQLTVNVGPVGRGDIDWKHARPAGRGRCNGRQRVWLRQPVPASRLCLGTSRHFVLRTNLVASGVKRTSITEPDFTRPSVMGPVMSSLPK